MQTTGHASAPSAAGGSGTPPYGIAIVGTGGIANAHAEALSAFPEQVRVVTAVDIESDRAKAFAARWRVARTAVSMRDALAPGDVDTVVICTPPASHAPLAIEALEAGVNVVIEKPPTLSLRQLRDLAEVEARSTGTVSCIFQHRFGPGAARLRQLQEQGTLGRPLVAVCHTLWFRDQAYFDVPWRGEWDIEGGGPTMGHGIHQFDLLLDLWGPWSELSAYAGKLARHTNTEDVSCAVVRFQSGALATITNSLVSARERSYIRLDYERATVELDHLYGYTSKDWTLTTAPRPAADPDRVWLQQDDGPASSHRSQYAAWLRARAEGTPLPVSLRDCRPTMELVAAIYESAITGRSVQHKEMREDSPFQQRMDGFAEPWNEGEGAA
jgi:predicted dehydrogenase